MAALTDEQMKEKFVEVLRKYFEGDRNQEFAMDTRLTELGINSFKAIQLLIDLEAAFGMEFPDSRIVPEIFENPLALLKSVEEVINHG